MFIMHRNYFGFYYSVKLPANLYFKGVNSQENNEENSQQSSQHFPSQNSKLNETQSSINISNILGK